MRALPRTVKIEAMDTITRPQQVRPESAIPFPPSARRRNTLEHSLFLTFFGVAAGLIGVASLVLAFWLESGSPIAGHTFVPGFRPFVQVAVFAAIVRCVLFL